MSPADTDDMIRSGRFLTALFGILGNTSAPACFDSRVRCSVVRALLGQNLIQPALRTLSWLQLSSQDEYAARVQAAYFGGQRIPAPGEWLPQSEETKAAVQAWKMSHDINLSAMQTWIAGSNEPQSSNPRCFYSLVALTNARIPEHQVISYALDLIERGQSESRFLVSAIARMQRHGRWPECEVAIESALEQWGDHGALHLLHARQLRNSGRLRDACDAAQVSARELSIDRAVMAEQRQFVWRARKFEKFFQIAIQQARNVGRYSRGLARYWTAFENR